MNREVLLSVFIVCLSLLLSTSLYGQGEVLWTDNFSDGDYTDNPPWWIWEDEDGNKAGKAKVENGELILYDPNPVFRPAFNLIWSGGDTLNHRYTQTDFYLTCRMMMTANGDPFNSEMPHIYTRASLDARVWYVVIFAPRGSRGAGIYIYTYVGTRHFVADPLVQPGVSFRVALKVEADTINCSVFQGPFPPEEWELTFVLPEDDHVEPEEAVALLTLGGWYLDELHIDDVVYQSTGEVTATDERATPLSVPQGFSLLQNCPNPFNPVTRIQYSVATLPAHVNATWATEEQIHHVTLRIFDALGHEVRTLVDDKRATGFYTTLWDGRDSSAREVASGVYFCTFTTDGYTETRKMMLLR